MLIQRILTTAATLIALCIFVAPTQAQIESMGSKHSTPNPNQDLEQPFNPYGDFDHDLQFFKPLDYADLNPEPKLNTGFFASYDRMLYRVSAPQQLTIANSGFGDHAASFDWNTVGNRLELGFMGAEGKGLTGTFMKSEGSGFSAVRGISDTDTGGMAVPLGRLPAITTTNFVDIAVNRTFRQKMKHGGYFEPYLGLRYISLVDHYQHDNLPNPLIGTSERFNQEAQNHMYGGQIGFRTFYKSGRWTFSGNFAAMASYNEQTYWVQDLVNGGTTQSLELSNDYGTFVPMGDIRFDFSYAVTRDISLRFGIGGMYYFNGINRVLQNTSSLNPNSLNYTQWVAGNTRPQGIFLMNDQRTIHWGGTIGLEWRR